MPKSTRHRRCKRATIPIGLGLVVFVLFTVLVPVIIAVALTSSRSNERLRSMSSLTSRIQANGIGSMMNSGLQTVERSTVPLARSFEKGVYSLSDPRGFLGGFIATIQGADGCTTMSLLMPNGAVYGATRLNASQYIVRTTLTNGSVCDFYADPTTLQTALPALRCRPIAPASSDVRYMSSFPYSSFSVSAFNESRLFMGVVAQDCTLGTIRAIIKSLAEKNNYTKGLVFLVDINEATILASSNVSLRIFTKGTNGDLIRTPVSQVDNFYVHEADVAIRKRFGTWPGVSDDTFSLDSGLVISVVSIARAGLVWGLVSVQDPGLVTLEPAVIGAIAGTTAFFLIAALLFGAVVGRPLTVLSQEMAAVSKLSFSRSSTRRGRLSAITEIRSMQEAFLRLKAGTRALTKYISPQVVMQAMHPEQGDTEPPEMTTRSVTIVFVELKGFNALSERLSPSQQEEVMNSWFMEFGTTIQRNKGTIDKFIGDAIMALFGVPEALPNSELRACQTALEFKRAMDRVGGKAAAIGVTEPLTYRVGIHSGNVLLGHPGVADRLNYTVSGKAANQASRIEQLGKEYGVNPLISGSVESSVHGKYLSVFLDVLSFRGHGTPTKVFHLVGPISGASPVDHLAAETFNSIHESVSANMVAAAIHQIDVAATIPGLSAYRTALAILKKNITSGATSPSSYAEQQCSTEGEMTPRFSFQMPRNTDQPEQHKQPDEAEQSVDCDIVSVSGGP